MAKNKQKIGTMKELSEAIGVSRPTLSRYFQDPSAVRPSTSQKIEERLKEIDYVYNFIATRQNRKSSGLVGVIIPYYNDLFFTSLLQAIEKAARGAGYTVITQSSDGNSEGEAGDSAHDDPDAFNPEQQHAHDPEGGAGDHGEDILGSHDGVSSPERGAATRGPGRCDMSGETARKASLVHDSPTVIPTTTASKTLPGHGET